MVHGIAIGAARDDRNVELELAAKGSANVASSISRSKTMAAKAAASSSFSFTIVAACNDQRICSRV